MALGMRALRRQEEPQTLAAQDNSCSAVQCSAVQCSAVQWRALVRRSDRLVAAAIGFQGRGAVQRAADADATAAAPIRRRRRRRRCCSRGAHRTLSNTRNQPANQRPTLQERAEAATSRAAQVASARWSCADEDEEQRTAE